MAKAFFFLALIIQATLIYANDIDDHEEETPSREILNQRPEFNDEVVKDFKNGQQDWMDRDVLEQKPEFDDEVVKDFKDGQQDWMDLFFMPLPNRDFHPSSSAALMAAVTNSNKTCEEQLADIKEMASKITLAIQSEMANLLSYALSHCNKEHEDENHPENQLRRKRETPMDSSELVMRLLRHIKSNNEYQNIAIEKMMSAQEIADKFGIEFNPDPEILSDLAIAANEQAKEMTSILHDAIDLNAAKNVTNEHVEFIPIEECEQSPVENDTYYVYSVHYPDQEYFGQHSYPPYDYMPEQIHREHHEMNQGHHNHGHHYNHHENHIPMPPNQHHNMPPVTPKPTYYDSMMAFTPDYFPFCPVEPITTTTTIVIPMDEPVEPEPELVGEEYEETVSSKMYVTRDEEPGSATVNHVMSYTVSEKAHFKKPEIEQLPQQMQYTFFLM